MPGFMPKLWKKRKVNSTQSTVLGDCDETLKRLPIGTTSWASSKFVDAVKV